MDEYHVELLTSHGWSFIETKMGAFHSIQNWFYRKYSAEHGANPTKGSTYRLIRTVLTAKN